MALDAEAADLGGFRRLAERVDPQGGPEDDLVQVAVGEAVRPDVPHLVVGDVGLGQVLQDQSAEVAVVDRRRPEGVTGPLDEVVPEGDPQLRPRRAAALQVRVEQGELGMVTGAIDQQDLRHRRVVTYLLVEFSQAEVAADPEHREAGLLGPAVHGPVAPADHPLRVAQDDQRLVAEGNQFVQDPLLNHGSTDRGQGVSQSSSRRLGMSWKCRVLCVTSVRSWTRELRRSSGPRDYAECRGD